MGRLSGKTALVTGGARGIGAHISTRLAEEGAHVIIHYNASEKEAQSLADLLSEKSLSCEIIQFDVSNYKDTEDKLEFLVKNHETIDILVNNAGVTIDNLLIRYKEQDFDKVMDTNLKGTFNCSRVISKAMMKQREGAIVNITSVVGEMGNPGQSIYSASKAGIIGLTKSLAKELASRNIRVNAVAPGLIASDMTERLSDVQKENILKSIPLGRWGTAEEVAAVVFFLASSESKYITGQTISINGGLYI